MNEAIDILYEVYKAYCKKKGYLCHASKADIECYEKVRPVALKALKKQLKNGS